MLDGWFCRFTTPFQKHSFNRRGKRRKIAYNREPHSLHVYAVVLMPNPIPNAADVASWHLRYQVWSLLAKPYSRFANHQQLTFYRCYCFRVAPEFLEGHAARELLDHLYGVKDCHEGEGWVR